MRWLVGVDGGGTGCRAAVADAETRVLGRGEAGAANIATDFASALANILAAVSKAFAAAGLSSDAARDSGAVLGLAGANVGDAAARLVSRLPFAAAQVETDALTALHGALGDADGAIAIVGTGTAFLGRRKGRLKSLGGWGFRLGDWGGGARIGQRALEEALHAHDGVRPGSPLTDALLARFGGPQAVVEWAAAAQPGAFGALAPAVLAAAGEGDPVASRILAAAAADLAESLSALALAEGDVLCLVGGLGPLMAERLPPDLARFVRPPRGDALSGALSLARIRFAAR